MNELNRAWISTPADNDNGAVNNDLPEREVLTEIWMTMDVGGNKLSAPIRIGLLENGEADLSLVPERLRINWQRFGAKGLYGSAAVKPIDGATFLEALMSAKPATYGPWFHMKNDSQVK
jgi:hypothetical protein